MNEREAERLADQLAQEASAEAYAREHGMITSAPDVRPAPMTATERIAMLGAAESAGRFGSDQYVPLEPVRVVTWAEMDARRCAGAHRSADREGRRRRRIVRSPTAAPAALATAFMLDDREAFETVVDDLPACLAGVLDGAASLFRDAAYASLTDVLGRDVDGIDVVRAWEDSHDLIVRELAFRHDLDSPELPAAAGWLGEGSSAGAGFRHTPGRCTWHWLCSSSPRCSAAASASTGRPSCSPGSWPVPDVRPQPRLGGMV